MNKIYSLLNVPCYDFQSEKEITIHLSNLIVENKGGYSVAINAEKILSFNEDLEVNLIISNSILPYVDGFGAVIAFKFLYNINTIKINFPIIALNTACSHKFPIFILGSTEKNNRNACINIAKLFPGILICGRLNGFFDSIDEVINQIHDSKPKLVFLALGSPKQEQCANELLKFFPHTFFVGCGGAIDILSGQKKRAPEFFIDNGLEWLYRLWKEPKRIRRQIRLPLFLLKLIKFKLS